MAKIKKILLISCSTKYGDRKLQACWNKKYQMSCFTIK